MSTVAPHSAGPVPTGEMLRRLWRYGRPHRGLLIRSFLCMVVLGVTTGAYAYLMGPALTFLLTGGTQGLGLVAELFPFVGRWERSQVLFLFPAVIVGIGLVKGVAYLGQFYWIGLYGQRVALGVRRELFAKLLALSPRQLSTRLSGDLLSRFSTDVHAIETAATQSVGSYARDGLQLVILFGVALSLHWQLALATLLIVPIAVLPASRLTRSVLRRTGEGQTRLGALAGQVHEGLGGMKTIQAYNGQSAELLRFDAEAKAHERAVVKAAWSRGAVPALMEVLAATALGGALSFAAASQSIPADRLVSLLAAVVLMYQPAKDLGRVTQFVVQAVASGQRIFELLQLAPAQSEGTSAQRLAPLTQGVDIQRVSLAYDSRKALRDVSLTIPTGQITAVVGSSGGGKSTLTRLLLRFDAPDQGKILIDGRDIADCTLDSVRAQFALVTQEPLLFATSVRENIQFSRPTATFEEVQAAARIAHAHAFISSLPNGYDTAVGERGVVLSGGQKQRLCLARAVLSNAPLLILDEATSNLDPEGERDVHHALAMVLRGRTALVIAHRLSTVVNADRIYVLEEGRVVESGRHAELLKLQGTYAALWRLQTAQPQGQVA